MKFVKRKENKMILYRGQLSSDRIDGIDFSITPEGIVNERSINGYVVILKIDENHPSFTQYKMNIYNLVFNHPIIDGWYTVSIERLLAFFGATFEIVSHNEFFKN
jgi:hypothetical protein